MKNSYKRITEYDVYKLLRGFSIDPMNAGYGISVSNIASILKTSDYQVRKYLVLLVEAGSVVKSTYRDVCRCYEFCECDASGRSWRVYLFKNDLPQYIEEDKQQSEAQKKSWEEYIKM